MNQKSIKNDETILQLPLEKLIANFKSVENWEKSEMDFISCKEHDGRCRVMQNV